MRVKLLSDGGYDDEGIVGHVYEALPRQWGITILGSLLQVHSHNTEWAGIGGYAFNSESYEVVEEKDEGVSKKSKRKRRT